MNVFLLRTGCCLLTLLLATRCVPAAEGEHARYDFSERHMGTAFALRFYAPSIERAERAAADAFARIGKLDSRLSDYQPDSELNRLSRTAGSGEEVRVSDDLWSVLRRASEISEASRGAFDVTVGPYVRLWRRARGTGQMPSEERLHQAREAVGYEFVVLDEQSQQVRLMRPAMRLDLGGIAKGFAADEALKVLRQHGIERALVDAGGDLALGDAPPGEAGWRIAVTRLGDRGQDAGEGGETAAGILLQLANCGVATSGDAYQYVEVGGRRYSHIVDPRTGLGVSTPSSVTVIARDCMTADGLASAISVLDPQEGIALADKTPGAATLVLRLEDGKLRRYMSDSMEGLVTRD